jgi:hypothetical protein
VVYAATWRSWSGSFRRARSDAAAVTGGASATSTVSAGAFYRLDSARHGTARHGTARAEIVAPTRYEGAYPIHVRHPTERWLHPRRRKRCRVRLEQAHAVRGIATRHDRTAPNYKGGIVFTALPT